MEAALVMKPRSRLVHQPFLRQCVTGALATGMLHSDGARKDGMENASPRVEKCRRRGEREREIERERERERERQRNAGRRSNDRDPFPRKMVDGGCVTSQSYVRAGPWC